MTEGELPPVGCFVPIGGFVLAGGKSSRMGRDKTLLELAGKPLVLHAVTKLRRLCSDVHLLGSNPALAAYAPMVRDLHPECGPLGGIEAALLSADHDWNLILPVDMPFLPTRLLEDWLWTVLAKPGETKLSVLSADGVRYPALLLIHREVAPYLTASLEQQNFRLFPGLEHAAEQIAASHNVKAGKVLVELQWNELTASDRQGNEPWRNLTKAQLENQPRWFSNLNVPEEFADAEGAAGALDT
jgi:molybdenum cofactor guanylyltransferase